MSFQGTKKPGYLLVLLKSERQGFQQGAGARVPRSNLATCSWLQSRGLRPCVLTGKGKDIEGKQQHLDIAPMNVAEADLDATMDDDPGLATRRADRITLDRHDRSFGRFVLRNAQQLTLLDIDYLRQGPNDLIGLAATHRYHTQTQDSARQILPRRLR